MLLTSSATDPTASGQPSSRAYHPGSRTRTAQQPVAPTGPPHQPGLRPSRVANFVGGAATTGAAAQTSSQSGARPAVGSASVPPPVTSAAPVGAAPVEGAAAPPAVSARASSADPRSVPWLSLTKGDYGYLCHSFSAALPSAAKALATVLLIKAGVTLYHHYQLLKAEREVAKLQRASASPPMLITAHTGPSAAAGDATVVADRDAKEGDALEKKEQTASVLLRPLDASPALPPHAGIREEEEREKGNNSRGSSTSAPALSGVGHHSTSALSPIRILSVRNRPPLPPPGQWPGGGGLGGDRLAGAYGRLEKVLARVHLFTQPRWALAPSLSPDGTFLEAYMRMHRIPYAMHVVNVLHGGGASPDEGASVRVSASPAWRRSSRAASWSLDCDPTGELSGLTSEEVSAEQVRRVYERVYTAHRRCSAGGSAPDSGGGTLLGRLMLLVRQRKTRRLPFVVYRGEVADGDPAAIVGFLQARLHIPPDVLSAEGDEEAASLAEALRHTADHALRGEYGVGFVNDGPAVFCRYASQAMGSVTTPWAMRAWLALPWIGSPLRATVRSTLAASGVAQVPRQQRQEQALREITFLESLLLHADDGDEAAGHRPHPLLVAGRPTSLDCRLYAYLLPILRLSESDVAAMHNAVFSYVHSSAVLRGYVAQLSTIFFPDLPLMVATVTGVPPATPFDPERAASSVALRRHPRRDLVHGDEAWGRRFTGNSVHGYTSSHTPVHSSTGDYTNDVEASPSARIPPAALGDPRPSCRSYHRGDDVHHKSCPSQPFCEHSRGDGDNLEPTPCREQSGSDPTRPVDLPEERLQSAFQQPPPPSSQSPLAARFLPPATLPTPRQPVATPTERTPPPLPGLTLGTDDQDPVIEGVPPLMAPPPQHPLAHLRAQQQQQQQQRQQQQRHDEQEEPPSPADAVLRPNAATAPPAVPTPTLTGLPLRGTSPAAPSVGKERQRQRRPPIRKPRPTPTATATSLTASRGSSPSPSAAAAKSTLGDLSKASTRAAGGDGRAKKGWADAVPKAATARSSHS